MTEIEAASEAISAAAGASDFLELNVFDSACVPGVVDARCPFDVLVKSAGMNRPMKLVNVADEAIDVILTLSVKPRST